MKYQKMDGFESHLEHSLPTHLPPCYILIGLEESERTFLIKKMVDLILKEKKIFLERWNLSFCALEIFCQEIVLPDLFNPERFFLFEDLEKLTSKHCFRLVKAIENLPPQNHVILSGLHLKADPAFYDKVKRRAVMLDLSAEKQWEKKKRLIHWLYSYVKERGKKIDQTTLSAFIEHAPLDFGLLLQEIEKVLSFIGDATTVAMDHIQEVCYSGLHTTSWELAEQIVWRGKISFSALEELSTPDFVQLVGQIRYHLRLGLVIAACLESKQEKQIEQKSAKISPSKIELYKMVCKNSHSSYFVRGLIELFSIDRKWREEGGDPLSFFATFFAHLRRGRGTTL